MRVATERQTWVFLFVCESVCKRERGRVNGVSVGRESRRLSWVILGHPKEPGVLGRELWEPPGCVLQKCQEAGEAGDKAGRMGAERQEALGVPRDWARG